MRSVRIDPCENEVMRIPECQYIYIYFNNVRFQVHSSASIIHLYHDVSCLLLRMCPLKKYVTFVSFCS